MEATCTAWSPPARVCLLTHWPWPLCASGSSPATTISISWDLCFSQQKRKQILRLPECLCPHLSTPSSPWTEARFHHRPHPACWVPTFPFMRHPFQHTQPAQGFTTATGHSYPGCACLDVQSTSLRVRSEARGPERPGDLTQKAQTGAVRAGAR